MQDELTFDSGDYSDDEADGGDVGFTSSGGFARRSLRGPRNGNAVSPMATSTSAAAKSSSGGPSYSSTGPSVHYKPPLMNSQSMMAGSPGKPPATFSTFTTAVQYRDPFIGGSGAGSPSSGSAAYSIAQSQHEPAKPRHQVWKLRWIDWLIDWLIISVWSIHWLHWLVDCIRSSIDRAMDGIDCPS